MKERTQKGERIGGGFFVFRRGKKSNRVHPGAFPFEHCTMMAAINECQRLARANPGETYIVVGQCYDARHANEPTDGEANEPGAA
ncbi:MAG: hypothetical protein KDA35_08675 [Hyphomonadaceae bacterium]|nr:hypothetical protein [Hyphomonadaceae bacterium]